MDPPGRRTATFRPFEIAEANPDRYSDFRNWRSSGKCPHSPVTMHRFADPARFQRLDKLVLPWYAAATAASFALGDRVFVDAAEKPDDRKEGAAPQ